MQRWLLAFLAALGCLLLWVLLRPRPSVEEARSGARPAAHAPTFPVRGGASSRGSSDEPFADLGDGRRASAGAQVSDRRSLLRPRPDVLVPEGQIDAGGDASGKPKPELATRPNVLPGHSMPLGVSAAGAESVAGEAVLALPFDDPQKASAGVQPLAEKDVVYDEFGAVFGPNALFVAPPPDDVSANAGAVVFWLQPAWAGNSGSNNAYFIWRMPHMFENRISIFKNGPFLRFLLADSLGRETDVSVGVMSWKADEWHHVAASWGDFVATFYIDGRPVGSREYANDIIIAPGTPWYIGSDYPGGAQGANSRIRGFHVFSRALQPEEVLALMEETRPPGA